MRPDLSLILFSTLAGAGYGWLALLGLLAPLGSLPATPGFAGLALSLALATIVAGLFASCFHLSHPWRAWRLPGQASSAWMARLAVLAAGTFALAALAALFGLCWLGMAGKTWTGWLSLSGGLTALASMATVLASGKVYATMRTVATWRSPLTLPGYLAPGLMTGALALAALVQVSEGRCQVLTVLAVVAIVGTWVLHTVATCRPGLSGMGATPGSATGLGPGPVRLIDSPHTRPNYLLTEMGFAAEPDAISHCRRQVQLLAHVLPLVLTLAAAVVPTGLGGCLGVAAAICALCGVGFARWLFFANACHCVQLYYRRD